VANLRQRGTIFAFDAIEPDAAKAATFSRRFFATALEHELMLRPIGRTVYLMPPYILAPDQIADLAARTVAVFDATIG
jgi:adenosylmethionine-8-amino-7-oxononanoate aminotransferase